MNEFNYGETIGRRGPTEEELTRLHHRVNSSGWTGTATHKFRAECEADACRFIEAIIHGSDGVTAFAVERINYGRGAMIFGFERTAENQFYWEEYEKDPDSICLPGGQFYLPPVDTRFYFYLWEISNYLGCELEIETDLTLGAIRKFMKKVDDGHVMLESLNFADEYTGERWYLEGESR